MIREITLDRFNNSIALEMGLRIINLAKANEHSIAVSIDRLNHTVFRYISDGLSEDKHDWLRRKANVVKRFEESSLSVKEDLLRGNMSLSTTFGLSERDYVAKGGSIPLKIKDAGLIAVVTVSGLSDVEDHDLIVSALSQHINQGIA